MIYVVFDPGLEEVRSAHKSREKAVERCDEYDKKYNANHTDHTYDHVIIDLELEE